MGPRNWLPALLLLSFLIGLGFAKTVMPWTCLERCSDNINQDLEQIHKYSPVGSGAMNAISYEMWNLGSDSTLIYNGFTNITDNVTSWELVPIPMITSADIDQMRELFSNPQPFIESSLAAAKSLNGSGYRFSGYNIDFEPSADVTVAQDGVNFASFLDQFANALQQEGLTLSVCVASWNPNLWNFTLLASTSLNYVLTMDTYSGEWDYWLQCFYKALDEIPMEKLGIGLQSTNPNGSVWTQEQLNERFDKINKAGIQQIDIWDIPISGAMWSLISSFMNS